jgi:hypothetical protein
VEEGAVKELEIHDYRGTNKKVRRQPIDRDT